MRLYDIFLLAFRALWTHKIRTALLILSVTVGVAAIIALTSQTEGIGRNIISIFKSLGPDTVIVNVMSKRLTDLDISIIASLDGVRKAIPIIREVAAITLGDTQLNTVVYGIASYELNEILGDIKLIDGTIYQDTAVPLAIIGSQIAFQNTTSQPIVLPGQAIMVYTRGSFGAQAQSISLVIVVAGILDRYGAANLISPDTSIFIPLQAAQQIFNKMWYDMVVIKTNNVSSIDIVEESLRSIYGGAVNIISPTQIAQTMQNMITQTSLLLGGIAAISLIAAALGIFNMMLVTVTERTREIGTMKALGFKNKHILAQIIIEGLLIGVFGGIVGIVLGIATSYMLPGLIARGTAISTATPARSQQVRTFNPMTLTASISYEPYINPVIVFISLVLAILVSVISSLYPAWRAAKMDPVKALRYE